MKKEIIILLLAILVFVGCQENNSILSPENENEIQAMEKRVVKTRSLDLGDSDKLLDLNYDAESKLKSLYSKTYTVDGAIGGNLYEGYSWIDNNGQKATMAAILTIPSGAFSGELTFDIIFDMENYTVELYPSPFTFDIPVLLDLRFTGANLLTSDSAVMEFDYLDGEEDTITYNYMKVDPDRGLLIIEGAQLPHFSRYGWVRTR